MDGFFLLSSLDVLYSLYADGYKRCNSDIDFRFEKDDFLFEDLKY